MLSVATDAASVLAVVKLAGGTAWRGEGCTTRAVWGSCAGSGAAAYRTTVDITGPAYRCSCPSRKIPCKHALGLLLRWSEGLVPEGPQPPPFAAEWLAGRDERAAARRPTRTGPPADPEAAARRVLRRAERVGAGLAELDIWLADQVRSGLTGLAGVGTGAGAGAGAIESMASRLVDAQAPGVASWVRGLTGLIGVGTAWPERLLEDLALLRLLVRAHDQLSRLDVESPELAASVRAHVGYPVAKDSVLARPGVADTWSVLGHRDTLLDSLQQRSVWLAGATTGRLAVVLSFAGPGQSLETGLVDATCFEATLHFYPGARPLRALVGERGDTRPDLAVVPVRRVEAALDEVAAALAADPWTRGHPVIVLGTPVRHHDTWCVIDDLGDALPLTGRFDPWLVVGLCGGRPSLLVVEWAPGGWSPISVLPTDAAGYATADLRASLTGPGASS